MRSRAAGGLLVLSLLGVAGGLYLVSAKPGAGQGPRPMAVAGRFYPADAGRLRAAVEAFLEDAVPPRQERPVAVVAPHAGYVFSGQIAADAFRQAGDHDYDLVVILGTNHTRPPFRGVSFYDGEGYVTPLGMAPIDREATRALMAADADFGFRPEVHREEHSVEVQVPFVQVALPGVKIVAAVVGDSDPDLCGRLGRALARVLAGRRPLIVASSDLSHYPGTRDPSRQTG
jgi:AmmeMemoRadiSam system protein B